MELYRKRCKNWFIHKLVSCMQDKRQHLEHYMEQQTGSKLGKEYIKAVYFHPTYLTYMQSSVQFSSSVVSDSVTPWTAAHQAFQSITNSRSLLKLMSIDSVMPSNHLILCHHLLLLPLTFPSIRVFLNESVLPIRWPKYWSFMFNISPSNEYSGPISLGWTGWISLQSKGLSRVFSNTTVQKHQFFHAQLSL